MKQLCQQLNCAGVRIEKNCRLAPHSTFRIGGEAALAVFPNSRAQLEAVLEAVRVSNLPRLVIGKASNVVFSDNGFSGVVIFTDGVRSVSLSGNRICADAGATLAELARRARDAALSGLEFAHGIPGTLGGAVYMNAGAYGGEMSYICEKTAYFDLSDGKVYDIGRDAHAFGYRTSVYAVHPERILLGAELQLHPGDVEHIGAAMEDFAARRREKQPLHLPSAGSAFKRPVGGFAGKLIEDCGLKGYAIGGAQVSEKHAGFLVNRGGATARDVKELTEYIRARVMERFGVELECEIKFLGEE